MEAEALFNEMSEYVIHSRELLKAGALMELGGLDERVLVLCEEVLMLSEEQRGAYAGRLQQLFTELEALGAELAAQRDAVAQEVQSLPQHKKASVAYRIVNASDRKDEES
jgi:hypothetical protein